MCKGNVVAPGAYDLRCRRGRSGMSNRVRGRRRLATAILLAAGIWTLASASSAAQEFNSDKGPIRVVNVAGGLEHPWGLAFLPGGRMLVTERPGRLRIVAADGKLSAPVKGVPEVYAVGQGGLLDVVLDPKFADNGLIYWSYAEPEGGVAGTAVARGRLVEDGGGPARLQDVQVIFRQQPKVSGPNHWGSRLVFAPDGTLFVTLGERSSATARKTLTKISASSSASTPTAAS